MDDASLVKLSASTSIALVASGDLTVERLARAHLNRIATRNEAVLAWAHLDPELVLQEAKRLDAVPRDKRGRLHGALIGIKDIINTKGELYTFVEKITTDRISIMHIIRYAYATQFTAFCELISRRRRLYSRHFA